MPPEIAAGRRKLSARFQRTCRWRCCREEPLRFVRAVWSRDVALDRQPVARIALVNIHLCKFAQIIETNSRSCIDQAACWRNDKHTGSSARWSRKRRGVSNFSAKIEPAQKSEYVRDGRAAFAAQSSRERKLRLLAQNHSRSFASGVRGRQKKNPVTNRLFHWRFSPLPNFAATRHSQLAF